MNFKRVIFKREEPTIPLTDSLNSMGIFIVCNGDFPIGFIIKEGDNENSIFSFYDNYITKDGSLKVSSSIIEIITELEYDYEDISLKFIEFEE